MELADILPFKVYLKFQETYMLSLTLVGSVQYTCPVVPLCIVDASLSHYVGN